MDATIRSTSTLTAEDVDGIRAVLAEAASADGREAVSEAGRLRLRADAPRDSVQHLIQQVGGEIVGYAQVEQGEQQATAELAVSPGNRGQGLGRQLFSAVIAAADGATVDFWAHGGHLAARHLAQTHAGELVRELRQMRRTAEAPEEVPLPAGVVLRTFRPGEDDAAWLALNAKAFAHHPEQGSWTAADLADRLAEPWFDPNGFFLAARGERLVGFHWTKAHPEGLGEVYVVGVDPAEQGSGLGRALTAAGLRHLILDRHLKTVLLYVDADNPAAIRVYERLGFTTHEVDLQYRVQGPRDSLRQPPLG